MGRVGITYRIRISDRKQSTVDCIAPIHHPITDNSTVQHVLKASQAAIREVRQDEALVTFDLAVSRKAYNWSCRTASFKTSLYDLKLQHNLLLSWWCWQTDEGN